MLSVVGSKLISLNYNLCYECLSIIFDCKRRLLWLLVANWLATSRQLVAIVWQLVANQSPDAYLNMKTGIFLQIQDLAVYNTIQFYLAPNNTGTKLRRNDIPEVYISSARWEF